MSRSPTCSFGFLVVVVFLLVATLCTGPSHGLGVGTRAFVGPKSGDRPKLILISGSPGTGKSTMGMSVALDQGILKCISTDTVRAVMRSFVREDISPALHRSSYAPSGDGDDPVSSWLKTCSVLAASVTGLVDDAIDRGQSLVLEGVHLVPSSDLIESWEARGGVAIGCLLTISDPDGHKAQLRKRGTFTGKDEPEEKKILAFDRIRAIQEDMIRRAEESNWILIEQRLEPEPLDLIAARLWEEPARATMPTNLQHILDEEFGQRIHEDRGKEVSSHVREEDMDEVLSHLVNESPSEP